MACGYPLFRIPEKYKDGFPPHIQKQFNQGNGGLVFGSESLEYYRQFLPFEDLQQIPCGHCIQCYLKRTRDWATRILLECEAYKHNYFITLTYDDDHVPRLPEGCLGYVDLEGKVWDTSLDLRDFQRFMKSFRKACVDRYGHSGLRIFYCGEYGELFGRPHFHLILMNAPDLTLELQAYRWTQVNGHKVTYYKSPFIYSIWKKGIVDVADVCFESAAYVAGYVMKKLPRLSKVSPVLPEGYLLRVESFTHQSNRPGIGRSYFELHKDEIYNLDELFVKKGYHTLRVKPPRYYDKLFDIEHPDLMERIKEDRENAVTVPEGDILTLVRKRAEIKSRQLKGARAKL